MGLLYCIPIPAGIGLTAISGGLRAGKKTSQKRWIGVLRDGFRPPVDKRATVDRDATPGCGRRYTCIGQSISSDRERLGARGVAAMNLCKCADLDRAHGLVADAR